MKPTLPLPDAVQWSEGMLLSPQHLQQNDIYWHTHLHHRLGCITPHYRGVSRLTIDRDSLAKGIVQITALDCVLSDGHAVNFPGNYAQRPFECDVAERCSKEGRPVRVWVVLPLRGVDTGGLGGKDRRYDLLPGEPTSDENLDSSYPVDVGRLQARIALHAGPTAPAGYASCPLAEVVLDARGQFKLTDYHPPMVHVGASSFLDAPGAPRGLQSRLNELIQALRSTLRELAGNRQDELPDADHMLSVEVQRHLAAARYLAMSLPPLEIEVSSGYARPEELYRALAHVVGQVACIGSNPVPLKMEPYRHDDCMPQFQRAFDYIDAKLKLINTAYEYLDFYSAGEGGFARTLPENADHEVLVELKAHDGQSSADLENWMHKACIASEDMMEELDKRRLLGASARLLSAHEIAQRNLRPAMLYAIRNERIEIDGKGLQPMFGPAKSLKIRGAADSRMPAAIILYRPKERGNNAAPAAERAERIVKATEPAYA